MTCICTGLLNAFVCKSEKNKTKNDALLSLLLPLMVTSVFFTAGLPHLSLHSSQDAYKTPVRSGRALLHWDNRIIDMDDKLYVAGYIIGVFSAGFYVFARIPQIVQNVRTPTYFCVSQSHTQTSNLNESSLSH